MKMMNKQISLSENSQQEQNTLAAGRLKVLKKKRKNSRDKTEYLIKNNRILQKHEAERETEVSRLLGGRDNKIQRIEKQSKFKLTYHFSDFK